MSDLSQFDDMSDEDTVSSSSEDADGTSDKERQPKMKMKSLNVKEEMKKTRAVVEARGQKNKKACPIQFHPEIWADDTASEESGQQQPSEDNELKLTRKKLEEVDE